MSMLKHLFTTCAIGKLSLSNRILMPPMVTHLSQDGFVTQKLIDYYAERAKGGAGLIVVEAAYTTEKKQLGRLHIHDDRFVPRLRDLASAVHRYGAKIAVELNPSRGRLDEFDPISASELSHPITGAICRSLSIHEIKDLISDLGKGARRAARAGFDAIMIHGAHGYLISEFLSPRTNKRKDKYGRDTRGRARLALEFVRMVKKTLGHDFPVIFRISASERLPGDLGLDDAILICQLLQDAGVDAIDVVSGVIETMEWVVPYTIFPPACNLELADEIKKAVTVPVSVAGRINDPYIAAQIIQKGKTDFVDLGRALIADPEFPRKAAAGNIDDIRPCIGCLRCIESFSNHQSLRCSVNPFVGREGSLSIKSTKSSKSVLVVGGGPAGMQAAIIAAARGHKVTLWEKRNTLGGQLCFASAPSYKNDIDRLIKFLKKQLAKVNVHVAFGKEVSHRTVFSPKPDAVILATGAVPKKLNLRIPEGSKLFDWELIRDNSKVEDKVIIIGGGLLGCEIADFISERAKRVYIVESQDDLANDAIEWIRRPLKKRLQEKKVETFCGIKWRKLEKNGMSVKDKSGQRHFLEADQVVIAVGSTSNKALCIALKAKLRVPVLYEIGDCRAPRRILEAIHEGTQVGLRL